MSCAGLLSLAALWVAVEPGMPLQSDTGCPSAEAIRGALAELGVGEHAPAALVKVRAVAGGLLVELGWPDSPQAQYRQLAVDGDCTARARATAVVLAAWLGPLPATHLPVPVAVPLVATPARPLASPPSPRAARWLLGIGVGGGTSGDLDTVPAVVVEGTRRLSSRFGMALAAATTGPRQHAVGPGTSHLLRPTMALVGRALASAGVAQLGFDAGLAGGVGVAWGTGYPNNDTQVAVDWGPVGGLRVLLGTGRVKPWLAARLMYWVRSQRLRYEDLATGREAAKTVSPIDGMLAVGRDLELR